jgi:hypothetical protein
MDSSSSDDSKRTIFDPRDEDEFIDDDQHREPDYNFQLQADVNNLTQDLEAVLTTTQRTQQATSEVTTPASIRRAPPPPPDNSPRFAEHTALGRGQVVPTVTQPGNVFRNPRLVFTVPSTTAPIYTDVPQTIPATLDMSMWPNYQAGRYQTPTSTTWTTLAAVTTPTTVPGLVPITPMLPMNVITSPYGIIGEAGTKVVVDKSTGAIPKVTQLPPSATTTSDATTTTPTSVSHVSQLKWGAHVKIPDTVSITSGIAMTVPSASQISTVRTFTASHIKKSDIFKDKLKAKGGHASRNFQRRKSLISLNDSTVSDLNDTGDDTDRLAQKAKELLGIKAAGTSWPSSSSAPFIDPNRPIGPFVASGHKDDPNPGDSDGSSSSSDGGTTRPNSDKTELSKIKKKKDSSKKNLAFCKESKRSSKKHRKRRDRSSSESSSSSSDGDTTRSNSDEAEFSKFVKSKSKEDRRKSRRRNVKTDEDSDEEQNISFREKAYKDQLKKEDKDLKEFLKWNLSKTADYQKKLDLLGDDLPFKTKSSDKKKSSKKSSKKPDFQEEFLEAQKLTLEKYNKLKEEAKATSEKLRRIQEKQDRKTESVKKKLVPDSVIPTEADTDTDGSDPSSEEDLRNYTEELKLKNIAMEKALKKAQAEKIKLLAAKDLPLTNKCKTSTLKRANAMTEETMEDSIALLYGYHNEERTNKLILDTPQMETLKMKDNNIQQSKLQTQILQDQNSFIERHFSKFLTPEAKAELEVLKMGVDGMQAGLDCASELMRNTKAYAQHWQPLLTYPKNVVKTKEEESLDLQSHLNPKNLYAQVDKYDCETKGSDFANTWKQLLVYVQTKKLTEETYLDLIGKCLSGSAKNTFIDMAEQNEGLEVILNAMGKLYTSRRTAQDDYKDLNNFERKPNEHIQAAMQRVEILCKKIQGLYDESVWEHQKDEIFMRVLHQIIQPATRKHLEKQQALYKKRGMKMARSAVLELVENFEETEDALPTQAIKTYIQCCTGLPLVNPYATAAEDKKKISPEKVAKLEKSIAINAVKHMKNLQDVRNKKFRGKRDDPFKAKYVPKDSSAKQNQLEKSKGRDSKFDPNKKKVDLKKNFQKEERQKDTKMDTSEGKSGHKSSQFKRHRTDFKKNPSKQYNDQYHQRSEKKSNDNYNKRPENKSNFQYKSGNNNYRRRTNSGNYSNHSNDSYKGYKSHKNNKKVVFQNGRNYHPGYPEFSYSPLKKELKIHAKGNKMVLCGNCDIVFDKNERCGGCGAGMPQPSSTPSQKEIGYNQMAAITFDAMHLNQ